MILTGKQTEEFLTTNGFGKSAQVGFDLTVKSIKKYISGGDIGCNKTDPAKLDPLLVEDFYKLPVGMYSLTFHQGCKLPPNIKASIIHRSSILRCGGLITSGVYDPGFEVEEMGAILVVFQELTIEKNARVAQIVMEQCNGVAQEDLYSGQWQKNKDVK